MKKKITADKELTRLLFELSWRDRWKTGSRWAHQWPFSELKHKNKKEWLKLVERDRKERERFLPATTKSKTSNDK
jgi:hypothetical protein